jgi:hypothetical protein
VAHDDGKCSGCYCMHPSAATPSILLILLTVLGTTAFPERLQHVVGSVDSGEQRIHDPTTHRSLMRRTAKEYSHMSQEQWG